jgi:hypothetical protein
MRLMRAECSEVGKVHDRGKVSTEARSPKRQLIKGIPYRIIMNQYHHGPEYTRPDAQTRNSTMGRVYIYGQCGFSGHRDVVGQINILSAYTTGKPGKLPAPALVKHRMPHNLRLMRRRRDTGQVLSTYSLENSHG